MTSLDPGKAPQGAIVSLPALQGSGQILAREALAFIVKLHNRFNDRRRQLLDQRVRFQDALDRDEVALDFFPATRDIREAAWSVAAVPPDLEDRRVEITGPADRKMIVNAMNSGAKLYMACLEDAMSPTAHNVIDSQINLYDAVRRQIDFDDPVTGKPYRLSGNAAVLKVRPRGWHLDEKHVLIDGQPVSAALFDFGLFFFHNAWELVKRGTGPYFYLPKMEHYEEAALWSDVFRFAEEEMRLPLGSIKATVLIETLPAVFEAEEILYALRDYVVGLNCGRWDYIFSFVKTRRNDSVALLPDRQAVTMTVPNMRAYCLHVIKTCHKRGAHAIGGMAAQIPVKGDDEANAKAFALVREDKEREVQDGHDGTWVAHPGLVPVALEAFDRHMPAPNQVGKKLARVTVAAKDLLAVPEGPRTLQGVKLNVSVALQYLAAWLDGRGAVPIHNLMEDAATAEISRAQLWQWQHFGARLDSGDVVTPDLIEREIEEAVDALTAGRPEGRFADAATVLRDAVFAEELPEFITTMAYDRFIE